MRGALVISWGNTVRGREQQALEIFGKALAYADQKAKEGLVEGHEEYIASDGNFSQRSGMMIVRGEIEQLRQMQGEEEWRRLTYAGSLIADNFTVGIFAGGTEAAVQEIIGMGLAVEQEMGLI